ncbi:hypothetical protein BUALT_Bualt08G0096300 [Buddleja alternifolia]|uniref:Uncharacterized protein n=1 Tax=Buddleja alternifolia TaxID=168488 RepID=A0AAV6X8Z9_9LAMI|nr:hypothetical protein BUALT_Bualt08G0096300 [Buddleja alternifolia]
MATPQIHVRSISLPTSLHPTNVEVELQKLNPAFPKVVPISSEAIQSGLVNLAELYNSVEELTRSSSHHQDDAKSMEDSLIDGSIELLDSCSSIRELFQMIKENVQSLQSAFRRKGLDSGIQSDVATSISLPTSLHPSNVEVELQKLKSAFPKAVSILSSEAIQSGLVSLAELYNSVEELTRSSSHHLHAKSMEDSLIDGSIELLDSCSSIKELFQMIKENVQTLQSAFRRKGLDSSIQLDVATYVNFRKKMNKCVAKTLKTLKNLEQHKNIGSNDQIDNFVRVLREVSGITIAIFKGVLGFLSCRTTTKTGGWNLVSKVMVTKSVASDVVNEVGSVDFALNCFQVKMRRNCGEDVDLQMVQKGLQSLDSRIEGFERELERLFRQLVQTRVTLLNTLAHC